MWNTPRCALGAGWRRWHTARCGRCLHCLLYTSYTKDGYATTFSITAVEPYRRWEFDMENSNMAGHWIGVFMAKGNKTQVDFTENVIPKKWFMKPFVKSYLRKHQKQFVLDLKKALE